MYFLPFGSVLTAKVSFDIARKFSLPLLPMKKMMWKRSVSWMQCGPNFVAMLFLEVFFQLGHVFLTDWSFWIHISITIFLSCFEDSLEQLIAPDETRVTDYVKASGLLEVLVDSSSNALETWILVALVRTDLQSREEVLQDGWQFICVHRVNVWEPFQL